MSGQTLEQAAQGSGWVTIPGGAQKTCGMVALGWQFDLILEVFSNL